MVAAALAGSVATLTRCGLAERPIQGMPISLGSVNAETRLPGGSITADGSHSAEGCVGLQHRW
jgi:hypothetical protein